MNKINFVAILATYCYLFVTPANALHQSVSTHFAEPGFGEEFHNIFGDDALNYCDHSACEFVSFRLAPISVGADLETSFFVERFPFVEGASGDFGFFPDDIRLEYSRAGLFSQTDSEIVFSDGLMLSAGSLAIAPIIPGGTRGTARLVNLPIELSAFDNNTIIELFNLTPLLLNGEDFYLRQTFDANRQRIDLYLYNPRSNENVLMASNVPVPSAAYLFFTAIAGLFSIRRVNKALDF